jgi:hypothetical protein
MMDLSEVSKIRSYLQLFGSGSLHTPLTHCAPGLHPGPFDVSHDAPSSAGATHVPGAVAPPEQTAFAAQNGPVFVPPPHASPTLGNVIVAHTFV